MIPDVVLGIAFSWATLLLVAGGLLLLRASGTLHRVLALDVLSTVLIIVLTTLSYVNHVSYYIDARAGTGPSIVRGDHRRCPLCQP